MVYAAVLAGGVGKRMQRNDLPKQFLPLGKKCVLTHTTERFIINPNIHKVLVAVPKDWLTYTQNLFSNDYVLNNNAGKIEIVPGGSDRNASLMAVVNSIEMKNKIADDDIIVSHDAVRPFITQRIINENIDECIKYGAVNTVFPISDTPVVSEDGETIMEIPVRSKVFLSQTPQTFNIRLLKEVYASLTDPEKNILTDACKMFVIKHKTVRMVMGESCNLKITTPFDYIVASAFIKDGGSPECCFER